ncbi:MAG: hypothetical protein ABSC01_10095 [Verrucomicrobiota bacterium]
MPKTTGSLAENWQGQCAAGPWLPRHNVPTNQLLANCIGLQHIDQQ